VKIHFVLHVVFHFDDGGGRVQGGAMAGHTARGPAGDDLRGEVCTQYIKSFYCSEYLPMYMELSFQGKDIINNAVAI
jgi:hypothetical protein